MRILVSGGAGFIGSHLVEQLVRQGHTVRVLDALVPQVHGAGATWPDRSLTQEVELQYGDVAEPQVWERALAGIDAVYHLAAEVGVGQSMYEIVRYMRANTLGTAVLLETLISGRYPLQKLIVASSMSIYGEGAYRCPACGPVAPPLRETAQLEARQWELHCPHCQAVLSPLPTGEEKPLQPTSVYAISKRDQEELCLSVGRAYQIPTVALRFFNVYGAGQALSNPYTGVAAIFSSRLLNNQPPLVFEDGGQSRDFIHVSDLVRGLLLALDCEAANYQAINLGTGQPRTVRNVAVSLADALDVALPPIVNHKYRAGDIRHCFADIARARHILGFAPQVEFGDGVRDLVAWVREQSAVDRVAQATQELEARGLAR
ncbi:MAG: NAD-dependent epimerase/dehydratase family protein [Thermomicrobiales bacterium]